MGQVSAGTTTLDMSPFLDEVRTQGGYEAGLKTRSELDLDALDHTNQEVVVTVPRDDPGVRTDFLIGLLQPSAEWFGSADDFFKHYRFDGNQYLVAQIRRAIAYSLLNKEDIRRVLGTVDPT